MDIINIGEDFEKFLQAYIEAAKKTCYQSYDSEDKNFEKDFTGIKLNDLSKVAAMNTCVDFIRAGKKLGINLLSLEDIEQAGYDFWLTRNGHGSGFWDRPEIYGEDTSKKLTELAKSFGEIDLSLDNNGLAYFECITKD